MRKILIGMLLAATAAPLAAQMQEEPDRAERRAALEQMRAERAQQREQRQERVFERQAAPAMERRAEAFETRAERRQERFERRGGGQNHHDQGGVAAQHVDRGQSHRELHRDYRREHRELHRDNPNRRQHQQWHREVNRDHREAHRGTHREVHRDLNREHRDLHRADPTRREHRDWHRDAARDHTRYHRQWDRNWRNSSRYNWYDYRSRYGDAYRMGRYYDPYGWGYRRFNIGIRIGSGFYGSRYVIHNPWQYRLPEPFPGYVWVRYYNDVLLVDTFTGRVEDVIYNFFW